MLNPNSTLSLSILSGKGGVGKTNMTLNLGYALYKAKSRLLIMDFDVGLANIDVLLGISPEQNIQDLLLPDVLPEDVVISIEENGFDFLPAASGVPELLDMDDDMREAVFEKLNHVLRDYDYLFFDLGAGIGRTVLSLTAMTQMRVIIVTPEPTSLTDSYAVIKVLKNQYDITDFHVVVNMAESSAEAKLTFDRLHAACLRYLDVDIKFLGGVQMDQNVPEAIRRQIPLFKYAPTCQAAQDILKLAIKIQRLRKESLASIQGKPIIKKIPNLNV
ncbi:MinD/ParA family protein [Desulfovibrio inopinatus]|uniref:MinD/ParA family protein n=1 Tax=Desulfovibrio inopinatus TaxID=102109 RepID=UPI000402A29E|nr:MinD/ParA family protein [Desulfovibrio inopinatus]